jgi:DNA-directed RNA polymerase sigma subunit (sigma70/sigma32)
MAQWRAPSRFVAEELSKLPSRQARVLRLVYGLETGLPETKAAVAKMLGVSRSRVFQIQREALRRLQRSSWTTAAAAEALQGLDIEAVAW